MARRWRRASCVLLLVASVAPGIAAPPASAAGNTERDPLRQDRTLRRELGLRDDDEFVRSLHARSTAGADVYTEMVGIPLSDDEHAELMIRDEIGRIDAVTARRAFGDRSDFAGLFIDHASGGRLHLAITTDPTTVQDWLSPRLRHPSRLTVSRVRNSFDQLVAAKEVLDAGVPSLKGRGIIVTGTGIDEPKNTVRVVLARASGEARDAVLGLLPPGVGVTFVERGPFRRAGGNVQNSLPFRGGQSIRNSSAGTLAPNFDCSVGFVGFQTSSNGTRSPAVITAGHCGESGTAWYQYNQFMGISTINTFPAAGGTTYADSMRVPITQGVSNDFLAANYAVYNISGWEGQYEGAVGQTVCNNGAASYRVCGTLVDNNHTVYDEAPNGNLIRLDYLRLTTSAVRLGDSGGAVTHTAGLHYASGTVAGGYFPPGSTVGSDMAYVHIYNALRALQLHGVYTS